MGAANSRWFDASHLACWILVSPRLRSKSAKRAPSSVVDGLANTQDIACNFSNKPRNVLNSVKEDEESYSFLLDPGGTPYSLSIDTKTECLTLYLLPQYHSIPIRLWYV